MNRWMYTTAAILCVIACLTVSGCSSQVHADEKSEAPPVAVVENESDGNLFKVENPARFALVSAGQYNAAPELNATGTITADVSRNIPVISLASGRIIEIHARLGDTVTKGQLLLKVQSQDIAQAFADYHQATADMTLAKAQLERARVLFEKGAIAQKDLEVAEDAEVKTKVAVDTSLEHLRVFGADVNHPSSIIEIHAPVSGVITDQQVTNSAGTQGLASPNPFTISDTSHVWIVCDVYENDLPFVRTGEYADIHLNAYPNLALKGRISTIMPTLDPNIRTAKVRLEVENPGMLRFGMFVNATFHGLSKEQHATIPSSAILHLHDRDSIFVPTEDGRFRRVEIRSGKMLAGNLQEVLSGIQPGQRVIANALVFENSVDQ